MTLSSGFFNSFGNDRLYDAVDFSNYLDGIITNGCFPNDVGFLVVENTEPILSNPPSVIIKVGKAYMNGLWVINDTDFVYSLGETQQITPDQYHLVYFCFDTNEAGRTVTIETLTGLNPVIPADGDGKYYMPIAKIADQQTDQPTNANIEDLRWFAGVSGVGITTPSLVDGAVTTEKIADNAVSWDKLPATVITTSKLSNGAVTRNKLGLDISLGAGANSTTKVSIACPVKNTYYDVPTVSFAKFTPTVNCRAILSGKIVVACSVDIIMSLGLRNTEVVGAFPFLTVIGPLPPNVASRTPIPITGYIDLVANTPYTFKLQVANNTNTSTIDTYLNQLSMLIVPR